MVEGFQVTTLGSSHFPKARRRQRYICKIATVGEVLVSEVFIHLNI